jgi:hypothetical protein
MERLRSLTRAARRAAAGVLPAALAASLAGGCASAPPVDFVSDALKHAVGPSAPEPASQVVCFWQRRLSTLPDPTRDGAMTAGVAGQMFLITPDNKPAEVNGDLAVVVYDETPRPPGQEAMRPELWHYTKDTLKRLATTDERFGRCYVLFLPWPAHWRDVTAVKIMARYQSPGNPDLYAGEVRMALDLTPSGGWTDMGSGRVVLGPGGIDTRSVPDPSKLLQQTHAAAAAPFPTMPAAPAGGFGTAVSPGFVGSAGTPPPTPQVGATQPWPGSPTQPPPSGNPFTGPPAGAAPPGYTPPTSYAPAATWTPQPPPANNYIPLPSLPPAAGAAPPAAGPVQPLIIQRGGI